jgi:molybdopterin molybdotransferase
MDKRRGIIGNDGVSRTWKRSTMISVEEAVKLIKTHAPKFSKTSLPIEEAFGKTLAQDIHSERDQPPFNRMAMDGVAIDFNEYRHGRREFKIQGMQRAGEPQLTLTDKTQCIEAMTGGVLPQNATAVIRYEDTNIENGICTIKDDLTFNMMNNVHEKGSDHLQGNLLLSKGTVIYGPQIGIIASNGYKELAVYQEPRIAVISTGDELVDLNETPADHQIRRSNSYALKAELNTQGYNYVTHFHLPDDHGELFEKLSKILETHDVLVLSGGVSMGKFDFLPQVFTDLNVQKIFHKVSQRPGKPLWFGATDSKAVFALPGNPVSAITCLRRYVIPSLKEAQHTDYSTEYATLSENYEFKKDLTYFLPVKLFYKDGVLMAKPIKTNGSGDYGSLAYSNGFIELPKDQSVFKAGSSFKLFQWGR